MEYEGSDTFIDYYEILEIAEDATTAEVETALTSYQESLTSQRNNPLTMRGATDALQKIVPGIRRHLLSGEAARQAYDQERARVRQQALSEDEDALPDEAGLDLRIKQPFFFDPYNGFDTEPVTNTLRGIARRLDEEWPQSRAWISDRSSTIHPVVGYLIHAALRPRLARRAAEIIASVRRTDAGQMDSNEGIERCITLFNPDIRRPEVAIEGPHFDGRVLDAGMFVPDRPAQSEFTLFHHGTRGCAFGAIESRTDWMKFQGGAMSLRFALMPEGTPPEIGPSSVKIPLYFEIHRLAHNAEYQAELIVYMGNWNPPVIKRVPVILHVTPLPPRVQFVPTATADSPLQIGPVHKGEQIKVVVRALNQGDEALLPLVAKISTDDDADATPGKFRADQPITLTINTSNRPQGHPFDVVYKIDYREVAGAAGPAAIYVHGELFPTVLQSMYRAKVLSNRLLTASVLGTIGFVIVGAVGDLLTASLAANWFFLLAIPLLFVWITRVGASTVMKHIRRSGTPEVDIKKLSPLMLWGLPFGIGLLLGLTCGLLNNIAAAFTLGGIIGGLIGIALGFVLDESTA